MGEADIGKFRCRDAGGHDPRRNDKIIQELDNHFQLTGISIEFWCGGGSTGGDVSIQKGDVMRAGQDHVQVENTDHAKCQSSRS